jgi:hypothetical protein
VVSIYNPHCYMFRHNRIIIRVFHFCHLLCYTNSTRQIITLTSVRDCICSHKITPLAQWTIVSTDYIVYTAKQYFVYNSPRPRSAAELAFILLLAFSLFALVVAISHCLCSDSHYLSIKLYRLDSWTENSFSFVVSDYKNASRSQ